MSAEWFVERFNREGLSIKRPSPGGASAIVCQCAGCANVKLIRNTGEAITPLEVVLKKLRVAGWHDRKAVWKCPDCIEREKTMAESAKQPLSAAPDLKTLRLIMEAVGDHFDADKGCYRAGKSDEVLAKELGYAATAVARVREEAFGPIKPQVPAEVVKLQGDIASMREMLAELEQRVARIVQGYHSRAAG